MLSLLYRELQSCYHYLCFINGVSEVKQNEKSLPAGNWQCWTMDAAVAGLLHMLFQHGMLPLVCQDPQVIFLSRGLLNPCLLPVSVWSRNKVRVGEGHALLTTSLVLCSELPSAPQLPWSWALPCIKIHIPYAKLFFCFLGSHPQHMEVPRIGV